MAYDVLKSRETEVTKDIRFVICEVICIAILCIRASHNGMNEKPLDSGLSFFVVACIPCIRR